MRVTATVPGDDPPDVLVVPALGPRTPAQVAETVASRLRRTLDVITGAQYTGAQLAAARTGVFFLAEVGVLDGRPATTSWWLGPVFREHYPAVDLGTARRAGS